MSRSHTRWLRNKEHQDLHQGECLALSKWRRNSFGMYRSTDTDTECNALIYHNILSVLPNVPKGRTEGVNPLVSLDKSALSVFGMALLPTGGLRPYRSPPRVGLLVHSFFEVKVRKCISLFFYFRKNSAYFW